MSLILFVQLYKFTQTRYCELSIFFSKTAELVLNIFFIKFNIYITYVIRIYTAYFPRSYSHARRTECSKIFNQSMPLYCFKLTDFIGGVQQCRSTTVPKMKVFNSAENHQFSSLLNTFAFSALLYFGTVVLPHFIAYFLRIINSDWLTKFSQIRSLAYE